MEGGSEGEVSMSHKEFPGLVTNAEENGNAALAKEAESLFRSESYTESLNLLRQLNDNDPKVIHNMAITEFHRDGCTDPNKLLAVLKQVKTSINFSQTRCEELARAADEQLEGANNTASSPNGSTTGLTNRPTSTDTIGYLEDYDVSVPSLNIAVVYNHLKQYASALALLEPLFANIEPVDENCALQICLLLLDISLASRRADKAAAVLQYVEKSYGLGQGATEGSGLGQPPIPAQIPPLEARSFSMSSAPAPPSPVNSPINDSLAPGGGEENFEEDALSIGLEIDGSHVRSLAPRVPAVEKSHPAPGTDLKLRMHLHRVRYLHLTGALKAAKRDVKLALNLSKDNLPALLLKAQLEFSRGNYKKALKLLATCSIRGEASISPMILSNQACVYHYLKKHQLAALLLVKALEGYAMLNVETPLKLSTFSRDKSLLVYYNTGLVKLFSGNPVMAAHAFQESAPLFYIKPLFWLRLAECCIAGLEKGLVADVYPKREQLTVVVVGQERYRRLVLPSGSSFPAPTGAVSDNDELRFLQDEKSGTPVTLSMSLAKKCLNNALYLLERAETKAEEAKEGDEGRGSFDGFNKKDARSFAGSLASFEQEQKEEREALKLCVLTNLAFVELCLGNPSRALSVAETVLQQGEAAKSYSFLARIYAAEALCLLERLKEAESHLASCIMSWTSPDCADGEDGSGEDPSIKAMVERTNILNFTGPQARASLYVNVAAVQAMSGRLVDAREYAAEALKINPGSTAAVLAMVYVEVASGRSKEAVALLKTCRKLKLSRLKLRAGP